MPGLTDNGENQVLNEIYNAGAGTFPAGDVFISLHTADPGDTGANEVVGGSYVRIAAAFDTASAGVIDNDANIDFTNMPAVTVVAWGAWDASTAGNCFQVGWLSTVSNVFVCPDADVAGNLIRSHEHTLTTDDRVVFEATEGNSGQTAAPAGITLGTVYFVLAAGLTADAFTFSASSGGAAIDITASGVGIWRKVTPKVVNSGDTFRIAAGDLDIFATE